MRDWSRPSQGIYTSGIILNQITCAEHASSLYANTVKYYNICEQP